MVDPSLLFKKHKFLIGNHADELTPWIPILATLLPESTGYISIPCCAWAFDERWTRAYKPYPLSHALSTPAAEQHGNNKDEVDPLSNSESGDGQPIFDAFVDSLHMGGQSTSTSYAQYRIWLASLASFLGWQVEVENLRIPSTRNWMIVGRRRLDLGDFQDQSLGLWMQRATRIIEGVVDRGMFRVRKPEGKDH
jgi:tRNASer (uridine44-2'-O)-methyltransferase